MWISRIDKNSNDGLYFQWVKWRYLMYIFIHTDKLRLVNRLSNYHFDLNGVSLSFSLSPFWNSNEAAMIAEDYTEFLAAAMERKSLVGALGFFWVETKLCGVCCEGYLWISAIFWDLHEIMDIYMRFWIFLDIHIHNMD